MKLKVLAIGIVVLCVAAIVFAYMRQEPEKIVLGFPPGESAELSVLREKFGPISDALGEALGMECELVLSTSYPAVMEALRNGTVDVSRIGATQYVLTRDEFEMRTVAWDIMDGEDHYHAVLIGKPGLWDEPFTMDQLKGKTIAFVDPSSTSGYVAPMTMILEAGLTLDDLDSYYFSTNHWAGIETLLNGQVDVMATGNTLLPEIDASGRADDYVLLIESPPLVMDTWVIGPGVDPELSDRIADALLGLPPETFEGSWIDGLSPVNPEAYEFNEAMLRAIGE